MTARKNKVLILDTNLWISFLLTKDFSKLKQILSDPYCSIIFSKELFEELQEVASRPKFKKYFSSTDLVDLLSAIKNIVKVLSVSSAVQVCRDPKDDFLLSLAKTELPLTF